MVGSVAGPVLGAVRRLRWHATGFVRSYIGRIGKYLDDFSLQLSQRGNNIANRIMRRAQEGCRVVNSFDGSTLVQLADGTTKRIDEIYVGDMILAMDPETDEITAQAVTDVIVGSGERDMVEVTTSDGSTITATAGHWFWSETRGDWIEARDLLPGEVLQSDAAGEYLTVADTYAYTTTTPGVYNLSVDQVHTYFVSVGLNPILVHNCTEEVTPLSNVAENVRARGIASLEEFDPGPTQAFSGVFDPASGTFLMRPSEGTVLRNGKRPGVFVRRNGDHVQAQNALETFVYVDRSKSVGFTAFLTNSDEISVAWYSIGVNRKFENGDFAPESVRQAVMDAIRTTTKKQVISLGGARQP